MPFPYITNDQLQASVLAVLHTDPSNPSLGSEWSTIIANANLSGCNDVREALLGKGFTIAQIEAWDQLGVYCLDQGTYWALLRAGVSNEQISEAKLKSFDRREELDKKGFLTAGSTILYPMPDASPVGGISFGRNKVREQLSREYDRKFGRPGGWC